MRFGFYFLTVFSIVNLSMTYILIHIYLKIKHSQSIKIAEKSNLNVKSSFITFRCHVLLYFLFGGICLSHFYINNKSFESNSASAPALDSVVNILSTLFAVTFVFKKHTVIEFLKRRLIVLKNPPNGNNKVFPITSRRIAWDRD